MRATLLVAGAAREDCALELGSSGDARLACLFDACLFGVSLFAEVGAIWISRSAYLFSCFVCFVVFSYWRSARRVLLAGIGTEGSDAIRVL